MCAHAVRVAIKNIDGVQSVDVSLSKGTAVVTFAPGNHVRYEQLLSAIAKNGFAVKGTRIVVEGTIAAEANAPSLRVSGSGDVFRLVPGRGAASPTASAGTRVEVEGEIPELAKGQKAETLRYDAVRGTP